MGKAQPKFEVITNYVIDKNVPLPKKRYRRSNRATKYPFPHMDKGDSFFVAGTDLECRKPIQASYKWGETHKRKFTYRKEDGGVRIWRTR